MRDPGDFYAGRKGFGDHCHYPEDRLGWIDVVCTPGVLHSPPLTLNFIHTHTHTCTQLPWAYSGHRDIRLPRTVTVVPFDLGFAPKPSGTVTS